MEVPDMATGKNPFPRIRWASDFVTVDFGNNRGLSASFGGEKARGIVPFEVFDGWCVLFNEMHTLNPCRVALTPRVKAVVDAINAVTTPVPLTRQERVAAFVARIADMWPEWDKAPDADKYLPGMAVKMKFGKRKPIIDGTVESVRGTMVTCRFPDEYAGPMRIPMDMLDEYNKAA